VADPGVLKEGWLTLQSDIRTIRDKIAPVIGFVPFLDFKLKRPQIGGWLATQSTPPRSAPALILTLEQ